MRRETKGPALNTGQIEQVIGGNILRRSSNSSSTSTFLPNPFAFVCAKHVRQDPNYDKY